MTMRISKNRIDLDDKVLQKPVLKDYGETVVTDTAGVADTGYHLSFDGNDYITVTGLLGSPATATLCAWVNLTAADTETAEVISLGNSLQLRCDRSTGGDGIQGNYYNGSDWNNSTSSGVFIEGTGWHHLVYVCDPGSSEQFLYIDGVEVASDTFSDAISYSLNSNTIFGKHNNSLTTYDFTGFMDDVRVYSRALSPAEVTDLYNGDAVLSTNLEAHWKFDDGSGSSATDSSGNTHTGTITGASWVAGDANFQASSYIIDFTEGNVFDITLEANAALIFANPPVSGTAGSFTLYLTQDTTGGHTVTWPGAVKWAGGVEPEVYDRKDSVNVFNFITTDAGLSWYGFPSGGQVSAPKLSFIGVRTDSSNATTYNFSSVNIGTASSDRLVIVGTGSSETGTARGVSSVSIDGSGAALNSVATANDWSPVAIASRVVTTGTTADISVTFTGSVLNAVIYVWTLKNYVTATEYDSDAVQGTDSSSRAVTFDIPESGVAVYVCVKGTTTSIEWSSANEQNQSTLETRSFAAADKTTADAVSSHTETVTYGTGAAGNGLAGASWT